MANNNEPKKLTLKINPHLKESEASLVRKSEFRTVEEILKLLKISKPTLYKHLKLGLPSIKIGKLRRFDEDLVRNYFN